MKRHDFAQGSAQWHAHRAAAFNASDAPAMMGVSPHKTRSQLLHEMATGMRPEPDAFTQRRFDEGHRAEALARPLAEEVIGRSLYPVVGSVGNLSASFDGLDAMEETALEHKLLNDELRAALVDGCTGADLPLAHQVQMEHQHMVSGAARTLFMASQWTEAGELVEESHCWYTPNPDLAERVRAGWEQFAVDLAAYVPEQAAAPQAAGRAPDSLPALRIEVTGAVTASNLAGFKAHALAVFAGIKRDLQTDEDFANAAATVTWCGNVEDRLAAAKAHALSQTESIDALFRTIDEISAEARRVRLDLDAMVEARKKALRIEVVTEGGTALRAHVAELNGHFEKPYLPVPAADFGAAIKGKKSVASMREAVSVTLANAKADATRMAAVIQKNRDSLKNGDVDWILLFADFATAGQKPAEDFAALFELRKRQHDDTVEAKRKADETAAHPVAVAQPVAEPAPVAAPTVAAPRRAYSSGGSQADTRPPITTGTLCARLGDGITLTAAFIQGLGIEPAPRPAEAKSSTYWREADFARICRAIAERMDAIAAGGATTPARQADEVPA